MYLVNHGLKIPPKKTERTPGKRVCVCVYEKKCFPRLTNRWRIGGRAGEGVGPWKNHWIFRSGSGDPYTKMTTMGGSWWLNQAL